MTTHTAAATQRPTATRRSPAASASPTWDVKASPVPLHLARSSSSSRSSASSRCSTRAACRCTTGTSWRATATSSASRTSRVVLRPGQVLDRAAQHPVSIFLLLGSVPQVIFALLIAAVLDANLRAKTFWRMGVLLPYVVAPVAVGPHLRPACSPTSSASSTTSSASSASSPVRWHVDPLASHVAIATMVNFRWTGYNALIFLAAMQAIPRDYYEAAMIDGAGRVRQFFSITIPQLRPTLIFVIVTSTIGGLQIFDEPRLYDQYGTGGADYQWLTLTMYLYDLGWNQLDFGRASAVAWLLFLIIVVIGLHQSRDQPPHLEREEAADGRDHEVLSRTARRAASAAAPPSPCRRTSPARLASATPSSALVLLAAVFPLYWSFLIGSGDSSTVRDAQPVVDPGRQLHRQRRRGHRPTAPSTSGRRSATASWSRRPCRHPSCSSRPSPATPSRSCASRAAVRCWSSSSRPWRCRPSSASCRCTS